jgi:hypothetical protein
MLNAAVVMKYYMSLPKVVSICNYYLHKCE